MASSAATSKFEFLEKRGYHTFEPIDSGGQGTVYKTVKDGKLFAIKVLTVDLKGNADAKVDTDLIRELNIIRQLRHPNCVRMEDAFRTRAKVYIVMRYLPGGTLGSVVKNYGPLCEWNCKVWYPPIARAVRYLHRNKVAHRDLKLDNVLLDEYQNPYVCDYGFARFVRDPLSDTYCGTRSYNPPQILMRMPYDPYKGDSWCLGVMFFIMLNKVYPFDKKETDEEMYARMMAKDYRLSAKVEAKVSGAAKNLISITIEPNESKRADIETICGHCWMPIVYEEASCIIEQMEKMALEEQTKHQEENKNNPESDAKE